MELKIKVKELSELVNGISEITGIKDFNKSINFGRDYRDLKNILDDNMFALKVCKPSNYDELQSELQTLMRKKASEYTLKEGEVVNDNAVASSVMLTWDKATDWDNCVKDYNERVYEINNKTITFQTRVEFTQDDFTNIIDNVKTAAVLSYFIKS